MYLASRDIHLARSTLKSYLIKKNPLGHPGDNIIAFVTDLTIIKVPHCSNLLSDDYIVYSTWFIGFYIEYNGSYLSNKILVK